MDSVYTFSLHEYLLLLSLRHAQHVPGITQPYSNPQQAQAYISQALKSLHEKGYITRKYNRVALSPYIDPIISVCAAPDRSFIATYTNADQHQDIRLFHFSRHLVVEDRLLPEKARQLSSATEITQIADRLSRQFHLNGHPTASGEPFTLSSAVWDAIIQTPAKDELNISMQLQKSGLSEAQAARVTRIVANPLSNSALARLNARGSILPESSFGLLETRDGFWQISLARQGEIDFAPIEVATIKRKIIADLTGSGEGIEK